MVKAMKHWTKYRWAEGLAVFGNCSGKISDRMQETVAVVAGRMADKAIEISW